MKMDSFSLDSELSDDEIFYGKLSLKEVKKKLFLHDHRQTISYDQPFIQKENKEVSNSFKIIEVHSEPEMTPRANIFKFETEVTERNSDPDISTRHSYSNWDVKSSEDSFLKIEKMVSKLCTSPDREELDNILEIVDQILSSKRECVKSASKLSKTYNSDQKYLKTINKMESETTITEVKNIEKCEIKTENREEYKSSPELKTNSSLLPVNKNEEFCKEITNEMVIPSKEVTHHTPAPSNNTIFKTPSTLSIKKYVHLQKTTPLSGQKLKHTPYRVNNLTPHQQNSIPSKLTPHKTKAYQHISSPVASYIRQSPQVPLLKDVFPKKPLTGPSHIPKPVKTELKGSNKENVMLPPVAYKSAKKTRVINVPDKEKLPQSPWAKHIATTLPKPSVIRHDHRETNGLPKFIASSHDSFADLSLHQADVSVCTKKSALNKL